MSDIINIIKNYHAYTFTMPKLISRQDYGIENDNDNEIADYYRIETENSDGFVIPNYDFESNWFLALAHLKSEDGRKAVRFAIEEWLTSETYSYLISIGIEHTYKNLQKFRSENKNNPQFRHLIYRTNALPFSYSKSSFGCERYINFQDELQDVLNKYSVTEPSLEIDSELEEIRKRNTYEKLTDKIIDTYFKNAFSSYIIPLSCKTYGAVINLFLANKLEPNENWGLVKNEHHLVCVNNFKIGVPTKVFDILLYDNSEPDFDGTAGYLFATNYAVFEKRYRKNVNKCVIKRFNSF